MSRWSIHLENDDYVVYESKRTGTGQTIQTGKKVGSYLARMDAASAIHILEMKERKKAAIAAAKDLLGV